MATTVPLPYDFDAPSGGLRLEESSDETLAHLVAEASEPAFAALYERHYQALYRYCRSIVRDDTDAQDVLQSAWTRALVALRHGRRDAPVRPWLYRIVHNEAISLLRRRGRGAERPALTTDRVPSAEDRALDRERFWALLADLHQLPERPRGALLMRELSGLSHEEIAAALDTSVSAAKQSIYEARRDLAELAAGRATPCDDICRHISDGDRRVLRGRRVAAHLRACSSCADFASAIDTRTRNLHALGPWLAPMAAAAMLDGAFRAGWGAGAGAAGTTAGAAGTGAASATGAAATPAAMTAGVVTKAIGVPLLSKSLLAVVAVTAGVASAVGVGHTDHARSATGPTHTRPGTLRAASAAHTHPVTPATRHSAAAAASAAHARASAAGVSRPVSPAGTSHAASAHGRSAAAAAAAHGNGRHVAAGHPSGVSPGQAKKATATTPPGQARKATTTTPPGQAKKTAATTPPGQAKRTTTTASSGQASRADTTPPGQVKHVTGGASNAVNKVTTTASDQANKPATTPPGHTKTANPLPPGQTSVASTAGNSAAAH